MTQERFLKLLSNPDLLASISYEELKTLALTHPFAHNLRYLLAIKAGQDNHPDFARNLASAAAYSLDRSRLFTLIAPKKIVPQPVALEEEELVLELKPIETVQRELESRIPVARTGEPATAAEASLQAPVVEKNIETPLDKQPALDLSGSDALQQAPVEREIENTLPDMEKTDMPDTGGMEEKITTVLDFPTFGVWASQFNPPVLKPASPEKPKETPLQGEEKSPEPAPGQVTEEVTAPTPQMLAEKSVTENKAIVSETLAKLYLQQGYREKAIDMYERLCLAFPDKSAYFAAQIDKLKK